MSGRSNARRRLLLGMLLTLALGLASHALAARDVRLVLRNPSGLKRAAWPMTTGVPFPKGALRSAAHVALLDSKGAPVPLQARATSTWDARGSSVRWVLLDFQAKLDGSPRSIYTLRYGPDVRPTSPVGPLTVKTERPDRIVVSTGAVTLTVRRDRFDGLHEVLLGGRPVVASTAEGGPYVVDGEGKVFRACLGKPDRVVVEEQGPLRAVVCAKGWFTSSAGKRYCRYIVRLHAYAGQPFVRVFYTFVVTEESGKARFRDIGFRLPMKVKRVAFGGDKTHQAEVAADGSTYLLQYDADKYGIGTSDAAVEWTDKPLGKRSKGWVRAGDGAGRQVTLACRDLWQQFPKELEAVGGKALVFHAWPAHGVAKPKRSVTRANLQYLWFCHEGKTLDFAVPPSDYDHKVKGLAERAMRYVRAARQANVIGLAKTHELLVGFHDKRNKADVREAVEAWQAPPVVMAEPEWMCASGVFGRMRHRDPKRFPEIERKLEKAWDCERRLAARTRDYGMFHWGDGHSVWDFATGRWSDVYRCWRGFHHGAPRVSWMLYFRSGDPKYLRHAIRNARHAMDIDVCHYSTKRLEGLSYPKGKIVGALNDYKGLAHWHSGNRLFDYNSLTDFMLWHTYMTGDRRGLDVALEWGEAVKRRFDGRPAAGRSGAGVTSALIELYQATWDPAYKRVIDAHVSNFLDKVQVMDPTKKVGGRSLPKGAFPGWENYAPWLQRYVDLTDDAKAKRRMALWGDAYLAGAGGHGSWSKPRCYVNVMAYAWFATGDPKYLRHGLYCAREYLAGVEEAPGELYDGFPHMGQMSLGPGYMAQQIPYLLAALARYGKPVKPEDLKSDPHFRLLFSKGPVKGIKHQFVDAVILEEKDGAFRLRFACKHRYQEWSVRAVVTSPSGKTVVDKSFPATQDVIGVRVDVPRDGEAGAYKLRVMGKGNYWKCYSGIETEPEMKMVFPTRGKSLDLKDCRYYFMTPKGATSLDVYLRPMHSSLFEIVAPDGETVLRRFMPRTWPKKKWTVRAPVKPEHAGKLWMFRGASGMGQLDITCGGRRIAQYLAVKPGQFFAP